MLRWARCLIVIFAACAFAASVSPIAQAADKYEVGSSQAAVASRPAGSGQDAVTAVMLAGSDLPAGFRPRAPMTGPLNDERGRLLGIDAKGVAVLNSPVPSWVRTWVRTENGETVFELAENTGNQENAQAAVTSYDEGRRGSGWIEMPLPGPMHLNGLRREVPSRHTFYQIVSLGLARGPYFFAFLVAVPMQSAMSGNNLLSNLAKVQWGKVPTDAPDIILPVDVYIERATGAIAAVILSYMGIINLVAYVNDPLREDRRRRKSEQISRQPGNADVSDVSREASHNKKIALLRFILQVSGAAIAVTAADIISALTNYWYLYLVVGLAIFWAAGRLGRPGRRRRITNQPVLGSRRIRAVSLMTVALVMVLFGFQMLMVNALSSQQPQVTANGSPLAAQVFLWLGIALVASGTVAYRYARRLGSIEARQLMIRDTRPPVLYLRSFGDDDLKLWTGALGRRFFIERFAPDRFDTFEEVLVRHLSLFGPVIALNPPGTTLPPMGAARATLDPAEWQSTVAIWMERSAQIVFSAPPRSITQGLLWEFNEVSVNKYWDKSIIVIPPIPSRALSERWCEFLPACQAILPSKFSHPADTHNILLLASRDGRWTTIIARRKSEWSYSAALKHVLSNHPD